MRLSILDQIPVSSNQSPKEAIQASIQLAQLGDRLNYKRYWIAEHHSFSSLASSNPSVMIGMIASKTKQIRLGAGAVLLPYYKPFHVAETYNLLATIYPDRIDLGIGRAPGGSAEVSLALANNFLEEVRNYPEKISDLKTFLYSQFPKDHLYHSIKPTPTPNIPPTLWLLGTSAKSGELAANEGLLYAFGQFMSTEDGPMIVQHYRKSFRNLHNKEPYAIVAVHVICAPTTEEAEEWAKSVLAWRLLQEKQTENYFIPSIEEVNNMTWTEDEIEKMALMKEKMIIGDPTTVQRKMNLLDEQYKADEYMVITITHEPTHKRQSYKLLKEAFL